MKLQTHAGSALGAAFVAAVLAACGGGNSNVSVSPGPTAAPTSSPAVIPLAAIAPGQILAPIAIPAVPGYASGTIQLPSTTTIPAGTTLTAQSGAVPVGGLLPAAHYRRPQSERAPAATSETDPVLYVSFVPSQTISASGSTTGSFYFPGGLPSVAGLQNGQTYYAIITPYGLGGYAEQLQSVVAAVGDTTVNFSYPFPGVVALAAGQRYGFVISVTTTAPAPSPIQS